MTTEAILQSMLTYMTTQTRLLELRTTPLNGINWNIPGNNQPPILKLVHENPSIENKISKLIQDAFGRRFVLNRYAFHDSKPYLLNEDIPNNIDQNSEEIVKWFEEQPLLDKQGDGVTAFCSIISNIIAAPKPMILIDEPETFLHPPQIRQLARFVAEETPKDTQIILATHSEVFVRGMIDFGTDRVDVIRLTREDQRQSVHKLSSAQLADLWQDPLLRTSNALSGLFHKVTAIVEGDSDERFLRSVIDQNFSRNKVASDLNFFHCGGKDRIVKIVSALRAIRIPTIAVLDIDVLDDKNKFYRLIAAFDGEKDKFTFDLNLVHEYIASKKSLINLGDAKQKIDEILNKKNPQRPLDRKTIDDCYVILKSASAWTQLKISGVEAWDFGEHVCALERIIGNAGSLGIIINRYGVLESLWKYGSGTKQEWLNAALTRDLKKDPRMVKAREFSKQIIEVAESIVSR